jgi:hypothetical protein
MPGEGEATGKAVAGIFRTEVNLAPRVAAQEALRELRLHDKIG